MPARRDTQIEAARARLSPCCRPLRTRRCGRGDARALPAAPGPALSAPPLPVVCTPTAEGLPRRASLLRAHAPHDPPRAAFGSPIPHGFAGCGEPLLEDGGARRSL